MNRKELKFNLILFLVLAAEIALSMYFTYRYGLNNVDADNSSEMVLARLLADEGSFLSTNWFYSTELRVLNTQIVLSLLFRITDNWIIVRTLGSGILMAIMACAYIYMIHETKLGRIGKLSACVILLPFCQCYQQFALFGLYYIPHVAIAYLAIGLLAGAINGRRLKMTEGASDKKHGICYIKAVLGILLAFAAGLGGIRMLVVLYFPMFAAALTEAVWVRREHCEGSHADNAGCRMKLAMSFAALVACGIGFVLNSTVLADIYSFKSFSGTEFSDVNIFARTDEIVNGLLEFFGYKSGRRVMGLGLLADVAALGALAIAVYAVIKLVRRLADCEDNERFIVIFFIADFTVNMFTFYFADMWESNGNYLIPFMMWIIPVLAIYIKHMGENGFVPVMKAFPKVKFSGVIISFLIFCIVINSGMEYYEWKNTYINDGKEGIVNYLIDSGYERGYADFWDANVFTEYSQGKLKICNIRTFDESFSALEWLMDKSYAQWDEDSKVFIIVDNAFSWENRDKLSYLNRDYLVALNSEYCVFGFENDAQLAQIVEEGKNRE